MKVLNNNKNGYMDHDGNDSDISSAEEDSPHHAFSTEEEHEDESQSDIDEAECESRRIECQTDMSELEKQYYDIKEQLYTVRLQQIDVKIEEIENNKAIEYLQPLQQLQEQMEMKKRVASIRREMTLDSIKQKFESEELAAFQNMESEKVLLYDTIKAELEDKIRRLEEDRHNIDITSDLWQETQSMKKKKKVDPFHPERRKKPQSVSGPYIVYMLRDNDVMDDWMAIKKAIKSQSQKRKSEL